MDHALRAHFLSTLSAAFLAILVVLLSPEEPGDPFLGRLTDREQSHTLAIGTLSVVRCQSPEDPTQAATDPVPVRAVPEDTAAAPAAEELFVVLDHPLWDPARHCARRYDLQLAVA